MSIKRSHQDSGSKNHFFIRTNNNYKDQLYILYIYIEGKGREGKGSEGTGRDGRGGEGRGREGNGTERKGKKRKEAKTADLWLCALLVLLAAEGRHCDLPSAAESAHGISICWPATKSDSFRCSVSFSLSTLVRIFQT